MTASFPSPSKFLVNTRKIDGNFSADTHQSRSGRFSAATPVDRSHFARGSGQVWLVDWKLPPVSGSCSPSLLPPSVVYCLAPKAPLIREMLTGPLVFLENTRRV